LGIWREEGGREGHEGVGSDWKWRGEMGRERELKEERV